MLERIGSTEIIFVLVVLLILILLFGGKKLPELAREIGEALGEFRKRFTGREKTRKANSYQAIELSDY